MPKDSSRLEVLFHPATRRLLEQYRVQIQEMTGKSVSLSSLVNGIVAQFLERSVELKRKVSS